MEGRGGLLRGSGQSGRSRLSSTYRPLRGRRHGPAPLFRPPPDSAATALVDGTAPLRCRTGKAIGHRVLLSWDVFKPDLDEVRKRPTDVVMQRLQPGVSDPVFPPHLLDHQLAVH